MIRSLPVSFFIAVLLLTCTSATAQHTQFQTGDIFLGQGGGIIQWRDANGTLIKNIITGDGGGNGNGTGLRIHPLTGKLWVTNSNLTANSTNGIRIINTDGTVGNAIDISAYQQAPTSITFDSKGNGYIGDLWNGVIVKINPAGTAILDHYSVSTDNFVHGPEWVEMDCNDSIVYYTNLKERVKRYNVVTRQQLSNFTDLTGIPTWLFAMRLLPDSSMIVVSADNRILRLNKSGAIVKSYAPANLCGFFGMGGTPDGKSFWAGGLASYGPMYKFDITSGKVVDSFFASANQGVNIHGIAVYGDQLKNCVATVPDPAIVKAGNAYPNPSHGNFTLPTELTGKVTVRVFNKLGQPVLSKEFNFTGTNNKIPVNLLNLAAGVYVVQIKNRDEVRSQKIIIN
ncbi:T9SS type A sorting domain-containing protein [Ferruginibacter sp. SUN106]|uniref:T9SS type A sorting domain-containing protein n=1 Tax=Ferruginibacter sp. SUN106 TaxID=2978348 RepID=UPI003D36E590